VASGAGGGGTAGGGGATGAAAGSGNAAGADGGNPSGGAGEAGSGGAGNEGGELLERIALCACLLDSANGPVLEHVVNTYQPQVALWYGDAVYADTTDPTAYKGKWDVLGANPRFQALKALCPQYAVWDDHDYGVNNGYASNHPSKAQAQQIFQDFWGIPGDSPLRQQEGVYNGFSWGPAGRRVQVLMLDVRTNRSAFGAAGTMLGQAQWDWLSARLSEPAEFRIIVSGVPWIATTEDERWSLMPGELAKFYALVRNKAVSGVVLVSGDDHAGEVCREPGAFGYDALDLTVAGLDRGEGDNVNALRITPRVGADSKFGFINIEWTADPLITLGCQVGGKTAPEFEVKRHLSELTAL
jgi:alkaline phosphatase D